MSLAGSAEATRWSTSLLGRSDSSSVEPELELMSELMSELVVQLAQAPK